jgi:hypothetical protein
MHRATADYGDARREMHRVLLRGEVAASGAKPP